MISDNMETFEGHVRARIAMADKVTLDFMSEHMDLQCLLVVYARDGFQAACDRLASEYEEFLSMLAAEREAEADSDECEAWLDNRDRARDMNLER